MATQHFKRNHLLNLYREGKTHRWFVSSCRLREIKMSGTCSLFPPFGDPWPSCLFPLNTIQKNEWQISLETQMTWGHDSGVPGQIIDTQVSYKWQKPIQLLLVTASPLDVENTVLSAMLTSPSVYAAFTSLQTWGPHKITFILSCLPPVLQPSQNTCRQKHYCQVALSFL